MTPLAGFQFGRVYRDDRAPGAPGPLIASASSRLTIPLRDGRMASGRRAKTTLASGAAAWRGGAESLTEDVAAADRFVSPDSAGLRVSETGHCGCRKPGASNGLRSGAVWGPAFMVVVQNGVLEPRAASHRPVQAIASIGLLVGWRHAP